MSSAFDGLEKKMFPFDSIEFPQALAYSKKISSKEVPVLKFLLQACGASSSRL